MVKTRTRMLGKNQRMSFSKIDEALDMPNLIEVQKKSFQWFLDTGLREVLRDIFSHRRLLGRPFYRVC